ncbi:MAG: rRNA maturation RNase YbeY [bacterium]|nr:rRNA maturation RNase YbeY [bacterium]
MRGDNDTLSILPYRGKTGNLLRGLPVLKMKNDCLGKDYRLSVVVVSSGKMRKLNSRFRKIDRTTDILSFPLEKTLGEMFLCTAELKRKAMKFETVLRKFTARMFIHGLLHLKGMRHGSKMEREEIKFRRKFNI